jgi:hypothetical protein
MVTEEMKNNYISKIYNELNRRGVSSEEIPIVIGKTGFMGVMQDYAEEQMHYSIQDAVDEILLTAATH